MSGHTAVRLTAAERVAALLGGPAPRVPSGGPAGPDETAVMAAALAGVRRDDLGEAERRALAEPAPCPAALAADTALRSRHRLESAQAVCALSIEAFGAPLGAYDAALDALWGTRTKPRRCGRCAATSTARGRRAGGSTRPQ